MKLIHYSAIPIKELEIRDYFLDNSKHERWLEKPRGLWISVKGDNDWQEWCENEKFNLKGLKYEHQIILKKDINILHLNNIQKVKNLISQYPAKKEDWFMMENLSKDKIDWLTIMKKYDGIIISPYYWECRFDMKSRWYYGWDCASGCIWNLKVIQEFKLKEKQDETIN